MNNIDGSYYAAMQFGEMQSKKRKEQEQKETIIKYYDKYVKLVKAINPEVFIIENVRKECQ